MARDARPGAQLLVKEAARILVLLDEVVDARLVIIAAAGVGRVRVPNAEIANRLLDLVTAVGSIKEAP